MNVQELLDILTAWVESKPKVRGYDIEDAELRLRGNYGEGRIAVSLRPKNPEAEIAAKVQLLVETLAEIKGRTVDEVEVKLAEWDRSSMDDLEEKLAELDGGSGSDVVDPPIPPDFPKRAFADFDELFNLEDFLKGKKEARFFFEDEAEWTGDPLIDP